MEEKDLSIQEQAPVQVEEVDKNTLSLSTSENELIEKIVNSTDADELKDLTHLFNIAQSKKNIVRISKLNDLFDKVSNQALERLDTRAFDISDGDLIKYMQVVQNAIEKSQQSVENATNQPMIQINQQNNINIEDGGLTKESRDKILSVIDVIKKMTEQQTNTDNNEEGDF